MRAISTLHVQISLPLDSFTLDVDLNTHEQVTGLFGPSGCGKTSFLESVAGLRSGSRGVITLGDTRWQDSGGKLFLAPEHRDIGYVPQNGLLFPHRSVKQNLETGFRRARRVERDNSQTYRNVVELLELGALLDRKPATLSGGERQRVALGRALCSAPRLLLLDEPLAALDQPLRHKILPFLRRIRDEFAVPMILVSHDPLEVQALCDDLVVLRDGSVIARGTPRDVLTDPSVFAIADAHGFENILPATISQRDASGTTVRLGSPPSALALELTAMADSDTGACLVGIPARDVLIALAEPTDLSARNVLPATVEEIHALENAALVKTGLAETAGAVAVEIGLRALNELALAPGKQVYLIVKATSCSLYEQSA